MRRQLHHEGGFTLIELLTIIGIIGVLASLSLSGFRVYRANAAYAGVDSTIRNARLDAEASLSQESLAGSVGLYTQSVPGALGDPTARAAFPTLQVSRNMTVSVSFDSGCAGGGCQAAYAEARHCYGEEFARFVRFGDGLTVLVENIAGAGC